MPGEGNQELLDTIRTLSPAVMQTIHPEWRDNQRRSRAIFLSAITYAHHIQATESLEIIAETLRRAGEMGVRIIFESDPTKDHPYVRTDMMGENLLILNLQVDDDEYLKQPGNRLASVVHESQHINALLEDIQTGETEKQAILGFDSADLHLILEVRNVLETGAILLGKSKLYKFAGMNHLHGLDSLFFQTLEKDISREVIGIKG